MPMPIVTEPSSADRSAEYAALAPPRAGRVLHLINGEHYAGAERVQDLLAMCLPELGFSVAFACLKPGKFAEARRSQSAPLTATPMRGRLDLRPARRIAATIRGEAFDLIHTHTPRAILVGRLAARWAGVPMVHHIHGHTATELRGWRHLLAGWTERRCLAGAARVIAVSRSSATYIQGQGLAADTVSVVPNGIPATDQLPVRPAPEGTWNLGTVALFRPRKGLEDLLWSMALLKHRGHAVRLRAVGPFETAAYEAEVLALADTLDIAEDIDWRGFRRDIPSELRAMDLFVFPSVLPEGMPMVVLEAMAAGVPIVATRVAGVTDVLRNGQDGLLAQPGDHEDLTRAILQIVRGQTSWQSLRQSAHIRQRSHFSDRTMAAGVAEVYRQVLGASR